MSVFLQILALLGAMYIFLYGMSLMSSGLQEAAGDRTRSFMALMTSTTSKGTFTEILVKALIDENENL